MIRQWIFILGMGLISSVGHGFTLMDPGIPKFSDPAVYIDATEEASGETLDLAVEAVNQYWNQIPTCALKLLRGRKTNGDFLSIDIHRTSDLQRAFNQLDKSNRILIGHSLEIKEPNILAVGLHFRNKGIVMINASPNSYFHFQTKEQKKAILAHEIGHAIGLGHSEDPISLMHYTIDGKVQERLSLDDYDGCTYLYPHEDSSCSGIAYIDSSKNGRGHGRFLSFLLGFLLLIGVLGLFTKRLR